MSETTDSFDINLYRSILAQNNTEDNYKAAETQRKCAAFCFEAACKRSDASACDILSHRLDTYTKVVYKDGKNIYNSLLHETHPNISNKRQLKVPKNLPKTNLNSYLKDLDCSNGKKIFCAASEKTNRLELDQFTSLFNCIKQHASMPPTLIRNNETLHERLDNFEKLQGTKQNEFGVSKGIPAYAKEVPKNKENHIDSFVSARKLLGDQVSDKFGMDAKQTSSEGPGNTGQRKKLGSLRTRRHKFVSPLLSKEDSNNVSEEKIEEPTPLTDPRLKNIEPKMVELIMAEIMDQGRSIGWDDIAGLEFAKSAIQEAVVWPMLRPDIFTGLRRPPKGILLFGPPGTGKTLIGKCVASQSKSTFFCISASSLTSKWIGDGEKMVRALFAVARVHQPAVIFIDEVDSLLTQRSDTEHESSRRIKTEFLVQLDGATTDNEERLLVIGATNRPQELDEAARRRFVKRLYIPLPEYEARLDLLKKLMLAEKHSLSEEHFSEIARLSKGYSGADIKNLCSEAALGPIRSIDFRNIENIQASEVRPLTIGDFEKSLERVRSSVSQNDLVHYVQWNRTYGSGSIV